MSLQVSVVIFQDAHASTLVPCCVAPLQKNMQMTNEMLREMMELACMWQWLVPNLKRMLGSGVEYEKIQEAWEMGSLDCTVSAVHSLFCMACGRVFG